jgi:GDPmannose 4,6-dehydratase
MKKKKTLIVGITGQDGSYMADFLLKKNYQVHGIIRKSSTGNYKNILHLVNDNKVMNKSFFLQKGDLLDSISIENILNSKKFDEIYNFADQDHVAWSHEIPLYSLNVTGASLLNFLNYLKKNPTVKYFHPLSSNMFGSNKTSVLKEDSKFDPTSIYAIGKLSAFHMCKIYRNYFNLFICNSIFFNHESPRRNEDYVTKKIIRSACNIFKNKQKFLYLGDVNQKIDWGYAEDYVEASWKMMQLKKSDYYIICTGKLTSIKDFAQKTFKYLGLEYDKHVRIDPKLFRPTKTANLKGSYSKANKKFGYKPKTDINKLIKIMIEDELKY